MIGPPRPTAPAELLCYARIMLCRCFEGGGVRLVTHAKTGPAKIHFRFKLRIHARGQARRRGLAHPTYSATRSMIECTAPRAYYDWLDTNAAQGRHDQGLVKELAS